MELHFALANSFLNMLFGLKNAGSTFEKVIRYIFNTMQIIVSYYNLDLSVCPSVRLFHISSAVYGPISTKLRSMGTILSYYNLSSVGASESPHLLCGFWTDWPSYYKKTIKLFAWESGWEPHWQGASYHNTSNQSSSGKCDCELIDWLIDWLCLKWFGLELHFALANSFLTVHQYIQSKLLPRMMAMVFICGAPNNFTKLLNLTVMHICQMTYQSLLHHCTAPLFNEKVELGHMCSHIGSGQIPPLLTDSGRIYRKFIGREAKTGSHIIIASGHDKQEIMVIYELVLHSAPASVQLYPVFSCKASLQGHLSKAWKCPLSHSPLWLICSLPGIIDQKIGGDELPLLPLFL